MSKKYNTIPKKHKDSIIGEFLQYAELYCNAGFYLYAATLDKAAFEKADNDKQTIGAHPKRPTNDKEQFEKLIRDFRFAQFRALTGKKSNLMAIDIDNKGKMKNKASAAIKQLLQMLKGKKDKSHLYIEKTPSGGYHLLFQYDEVFDTYPGKHDCYFQSSNGDRYIYEIMLEGRDITLAGSAYLIDQNIECSKPYEKNKTTVDKLGKLPKNLQEWILSQLKNKAAKKSSKKPSEISPEEEYLTKPQFDLLRFVESHYDKCDSRHALVLNLCGCLLAKYHWPTDTVKLFFKALFNRVEEEEKDDRIRVVEESCNKADDGDFALKQDLTEVSDAFADKAKELRSLFEVKDSIEINDKTSVVALYKKQHDILSLHKVPHKTIQTDNTYTTYQRSYASLSCIPLYEGRAYFSKLQPNKSLRALTIFCHEALENGERLLTSSCSVASFMKSQNLIFRKGQIFERFLNRNIADTELPPFKSGIYYDHKAKKISFINKRNKDLTTVKEALQLNDQMLRCCPESSQVIWSFIFRWALAASFRFAAYMYTEADVTCVPMLILNGMQLAGKTKMVNLYCSMVSTDQGQQLSAVDSIPRMARLMALATHPLHLEEMKTLDNQEDIDALKRGLNDLIMREICSSSDTRNTIKQYSFRSIIGTCNYEMPEAATGLKRRIFSIKTEESTKDKEFFKKNAQNFKKLSKAFNKKSSVILDEVVNIFNDNKQLWEQYCDINMSTSDDRDKYDAFYTATDVFIKALYEKHDLEIPAYMQKRVQPNEERADTNAREDILQKVREYINKYCREREIDSQLPPNERIKILNKNGTEKNVVYLKKDDSIAIKSSLLSKYRNEVSGNKYSSNTRYNKEDHAQLLNGRAVQNRIVDNVGYYGDYIIIKYSDMYNDQCNFYKKEQANDKEEE